MGMGGGFTARRGSFGQYGSSLYGLDRRPYDSRFTGTTVAAGFAEIRGYLLLGRRLGACRSCTETGVSVQLRHAPSLRPSNRYPRISANPAATVVPVNR